MIGNKSVLFIFRLLLGGIFIWTGLLKIFDPLGFARDIANYRFVPDGVALLIALILPWVELCCGILLILGFFRQAAAWLTALMLAGFLVLIVVTMIRGIDIECGCFGALGRKVDFRLILTDSILLFFAVNLLPPYPSRSTDSA
jgi:putative oxidoreductase